jgi:hypothetical protein
MAVQLSQQKLIALFKAYCEGRSVGCATTFLRPDQCRGQPQ